MSGDQPFSQSDFVNTIMPMLDRLVRPITDRMDGMDGKLDKALTMVSEVSANRAVLNVVDARVRLLEDHRELLTKEVTEIRTSGRLIGIVSALLGVPLIVSLMIGGVASLFHIHLPGT